MAKTGTGKFTRVADALRAQITSGALGVGDWLPSEAQLTEQYQVSRYGAREAIKRLAAEGLIVVVDGKGAHVRARRERAAHADLRALWRETDTEGRMRYRDAEIAEWHAVEEPGRYRTQAGVDLALSLGVPEHTPLFVYDRLLAPDPDHSTAPGAEKRRMVHRLYLPMSTCISVPALAEDPFRAPDELYSLLVEAGRELRWVEHVRATIPTPDDTTTLRIPTGAPVLVTRRIITDDNGRALAMEETRRSAEDTQLTYPLTPTAPDPR